MTKLSDFETAWDRLGQAKADTPEGRAALAEIMADYWEPLYHYVRQLGHIEADAQDLTQGFVEHILQSRLVQNANRDAGSFRGLLTVSLDNFIRNERRNERAQKRGGAAVHVELDFETAELRYRKRSDHALGPDELLHQQWIESFRRRVSAEVRKYYVRKNRVARFEAMLPFVFESPDYGDYGRAGEPLEMSRHHVAVFVARLSEQWKQAALHEAAWLFGDRDAAEAELRALGFWDAPS